MNSLWEDSELQDSSADQTRTSKQWFRSLMIQLSAVISLYAETMSTDFWNVHRSCN